MTKGLAALLFVALALGGDRVNPKLAAIRHVVITFDELGDAAPVAACYKSHLPDELPSMTVETDRMKADAIIALDAHLPSETRSYMLGVWGGAPSAHQVVTTPTGEVLFDDKSQLKRAVMNGGSMKNVGIAVGCGLADDLIMHLRDAMRKARDGKV